MHTSLKACKRLLGFGFLAGIVAMVLVGAAIGLGGDDGPFYQPGTQSIAPSDKLEELSGGDDEFTGRRIAGDNPLDATRVGELNARAMVAARQLAKQGIPSGRQTFDSAWTTLGPNPIVQLGRSGDSTHPLSFLGMSGRIAALAIRPSNGQFILGAAQGGIWTYDAGTGQWTPRTDDQDTLATGALAIAPSND